MWLALAVTFTHGVASGDVTPSRAVLWTRVDQAAQVTVEVAADAEFRTKTWTRTVPATADADFTVKVVAEPLEPGRAYYYRFGDGAAFSETGTFRTAPARNVASGVRFAFSGDSDANVNRFEALDAARAEGLDFFVYLGDTVYADEAHTVEEYRRFYKANREVPALRRLLAATSTYAIWDDHEVYNDYDGQTVDRARYAAGRRAFLDYMPLLNLPFPDRASCADDPPFRMFHWGQDIDIIVLDERSCRSADVAAACDNDFAPTLPSLLRLAVGLPVGPPAGCLDALADPSRTLLGGFQKLVFKSALLYSRAKFKFVINEVPIQQFYALPYDRWEGYAAERAEILRFIRDQGLRNVIFLTADTHANLMGKVFLDRATAPAPVADEFVTGPIATRTLQKELEQVLPVLPAGFQRVVDFVGIECYNLDAYSYGLIEVRAGAATISLKNDRGETFCSKTIGP